MVTVTMGAERTGTYPRYGIVFTACSYSWKGPFMHRMVWVGMDRLFMDRGRRVVR